MFVVFGHDIRDPTILTTVAIIAFLCWHIKNSFSGGSSSTGPKVSLEAAADVADPQVFFEIEINGEAAGRVEMQLFHKICPKTVENFRCLCTGEAGKGKTGNNLHFKNSTFHRII